MKLSLCLLITACAISGSLAAETKGLETPNQKASYGIGMNVAKRFKHDLIDLDVEAFMRGFKDVLSDAKPALTETEVRAALETFQKEVEQKSAEKAVKTKKIGDDFLAANKTKEGVKTTESGLQYKVIKEGNGPTPKASDTVKVHYRGTFIDGTQFDSSYENNEPVTFEVQRVIRGWVEALQKMKVGSKWQLFIPSDLAYGEQGNQGIPPHSVLIFDVELLGIEKS